LNALLLSYRGVKSSTKRKEKQEARRRTSRSNWGPILGRLDLMGLSVRSSVGSRNGNEGAMRGIGGRTWGDDGGCGWCLKREAKENMKKQVCHQWKGGRKGNGE